MRKFFYILMLVFFMSCSADKTEIKGVVTKIDTIPEHTERRRVYNGKFVQYRTYRYPEYYVITYKIENINSISCYKHEIDSINVGDTLIWYK